MTLSYNKGYLYDPGPEARNTMEADEGEEGWRVKSISRSPRSMVGLRDRAITPLPPHTHQMDGVNF